MRRRCKSRPSVIYGSSDHQVAVWPAFLGADIAFGDGEDTSDGDEREARLVATDAVAVAPEGADGGIGEFAAVEARARSSVAHSRFSRAAGFDLALCVCDKSIAI